MFFDLMKSERKWSSKWIWDGSNENNTWYGMRKKVTLEAPKKATAYIAAESRYWLYINGKNVVFEGGLKRGINLESSYYDEVDISEYLVAGENIIYALCWYWGTRNTNFSVNSAGSPGFLFEAELDGITAIVSDETWKTSRLKAYVDDSGSVDGISEQQPNHDLPEYNIYYDARYELCGEKTAEFDDSDWENAKAVALPNDMPWGRLYKRPIPNWKDYGIVKYRNSADVEGKTTQTDEIFGMITEYNCQMTPYICVDSDADGKKINIKTDTYDLTDTIKSIKSVLITKKGINEYEGLSWFSGEKVFYSIPKGIKILSIGYRQSGYNSERRGYFRCDDEFLNILWEKCARTLYVTMRDNFMDCPDRERAQWWGDANNEMLMLMYSFDTDAYNLYEKAWYTKAGMSDSFGESELRTVVPSLNAKFELPAQELCGVCGLWEYYLYSGNKLILEEMYPYAKRYVDLWELNDDGTVKHREGSWDWYDWGEEIDVPVLENAWYYYALTNMVKAAKTLGKNNDAYEFEGRLHKIRKGYGQYFTDGGFKSDTMQRADDRGNAIACVSALDTEHRQDVFRKLFNNTDIASPYMEKYVLDAMCTVAPMEEVQERLFRRFECMVYGPLACSTLWESWGYYGGSKNHAWSGGALITMSKNMTGIKPLIPGWGIYEIAPNMGKLKHIETVVPTVKGDIAFTIDRDGERTEILLDSPAGTVAELTLAEGKDTGKKLVYVNGERAVEKMLEVQPICGATLLPFDNGKLKLSLAAGKWQITVK